MKFIKLLFIFILFTSSVFSQSFDEKAMITEVNTVRANPKLFKTYIEDYYNLNKILLKFNGMDIYISEILKILDTIKPMSILTFDTALYTSLMDHKGIDTINGKVSHDKSIFYKIAKSSKFNSFGENIILASASNKEMSPMDCVIELLVDYGVNSRGHRKSILSSDFQYIAVRKVIVKGNVFYIQEFGGR